MIYAHISHILYYCTVHVYVFFHNCDSLWSHWLEANLRRLFYIVCVYDYFAVADPIIKEDEGAVNPAIFFTQDSIGLYRCSFCVHWLEMQINSSFLFNIGRIVDYQEILGPMYLWCHMGCINSITAGPNNVVQELLPFRSTWVYLRFLLRLVLFDL